MENNRFADAVGAEESVDSYGVDFKGTSGFDVCEGAIGVAKRRWRFKKRRLMKVLGMINMS